jgi:hypothetical protein
MTDSSPKQVPPYGLRMPPDLKDRVASAASANNRSMNAEIVATLEEKYPAPEPLNPNDLESLLNFVLDGADEAEMRNRARAINGMLQAHGSTASVTVLDEVSQKALKSRAAIITITRAYAADPLDDLTYPGE